MGLWLRPVWRLSRKCSATNVRDARWKPSRALANMALCEATDSFLQSRGEFFPWEGQAYEKQISGSRAAGTPRCLIGNRHGFSSSHGGAKIRGFRAILARMGVV